MSAPTTPPRAAPAALQPPAVTQAQGGGSGAGAAHALAMPPAHPLAIPTTPNIPGQTNTATPLPSPQAAAAPAAVNSSPLLHPASALGGGAPGVAAPGAAAAGGAAPAASSSSSARAGSKAPVRKVGKYQLGKTLGQGTFGKVKFATDSETGRHVAIKVLDKAKIRANGMGEQIKKEISIMKLVKHPSVIQLIEVLASPTTIYLVLELVTGGELFDCIIEQGCFSEPEARKYFQQLIGGIAQCHAHGVCHRVRRHSKEGTATQMQDLKPENLLLDSEGSLKISDFGLSALSDDVSGDLLHTTCGTPNYIAPEVLMDKGYDGKAADIWSSGVILYVLLAGFLPFDETSMVELFRKIVKADFAYPDTLSAEAVSLLTIILNPDPEKRATMDDICRHPWFRGITMEEFERERAEEEEAAARQRIKQVQITQPDGTTTEGDQQRAISDAAGAADASPYQGMRPLSLDGTSHPGGASELGLSNPATPVTGPASGPPQGVMLTPGLQVHTPGHSPALHGEAGPSALSLGAGIGSSSPVGQSRSGVVGGRLPSDASSAGATPSDFLNDPLSLDDEEAEIRGPIPLNAFDLINMVGGAAMGRMFQRGADKKLHHFTQFTTNLPLDAILAHLDAVLTAIGDAQHRLYPRQCVVKVARATPRGKVFGACQIYQMTPRLFMLEWRKIKGDVFVFHDFFRDIRRRFTGGSGSARDQAHAAHAHQSAPSPHASANAYGSGDDEEEDGIGARRPNHMARHSIDQRATDKFAASKR